MATRLMGPQVPRVSCVPPFLKTRGQEVIDLAHLAGLRLDPWQKLVINNSHAIDPETGLLLFDEVCLIVPRQNGKGSILEAIELAWLFYSEEELILHSAHEFKTAADAYKRIRALILAYPEAASQVAKWNNSHGQEGIELKDGRALKFIARTGGSGRGFPATKIVLDEAYNLTEAEMSALSPTLTAATDAQIWFTSSPVNQEFHTNGLTLSRVRHRGVETAKSGNYGDTSLCMMEWSNPDDLPTRLFGEEEYWAYANPAYGIRTGKRALMRDYKLMTKKTFGVEHLGIGDWPNPDEGSSIITGEQWKELLDPNSRIVGQRVFVVEVAPLGASASIGVVGKRADGQFHVEVIESRSGTTWVGPRVIELNKKWHPLCVVLDNRTPAGGFFNDLTAAGVPLHLISATEVAQAFSEFHSKVTQSKSVRHIDQPSLIEALDGADTRDIGPDGGKAWDRKNATVDITGLVAITNGLYVFALKMNEFIDVAGSVW